MKKWLMIGGGALALIGVSVGLSVFLLGGANNQAAATAAAPPPEPENPYKETQYIKMKPFVVSTGQRSRPNMLQVDISAATNDSDAVGAFEQHTPVIRNNLLLLLSGKDLKALQNNEAKEALRQEALTSIQEIMKERYGKEGIDDVFFTKFVMQ